MRNGLVSLGAVFAFWPCHCLISSRQQGHPEGQKPTYEESYLGLPHKAKLGEIPVAMRFHPVKPSAKLGLAQVDYQWWMFPKTTKRPSFAVVSLSFKDTKFPQARLIVLEWKHVRNVSTMWAASIPQGAIKPEATLGPNRITRIMGSKVGLDLAFYNVGLPGTRVKEMASWLPSDATASAFFAGTPAPPYAKPVVGWTDPDVDPLVLEMRRQANKNARALAMAVQGRAVSAGSYDGKLADYAADFGGSIPINPCTGNSDGYVIQAQRFNATVSAAVGAKCGTWTPVMYSLTL